MNVESYIEHLKSSPSFMKNVTSWRVLPAREAKYADFPAGLDARLVAALSRRGIERPYIHQRLAMEAALAGEDCVVVTPTASGKTLCYNVPVLNAILQNEANRALYIFPTKALSSDQAAELYRLIEDMGAEVKAYTYDGDTPASARTAIRQAGHVVVTNPDMLHQGILPHHAKWVKLFENLRYVVIDEIHAYRGVFGSNLANVIRRLKAHLRLLRLPSHLHLLLGHHRQPRRARRGDDRPPRAPHRRKRRARGRAPRGLLQPAGRQPPARHPRRLHPGNAQHRRRAFARRGAVHRLCPRPPDRGGAGALFEGHGARPAGQRRPRARLPRRLPAHAAARDRARAARRQHHSPWFPPTRWSWASTSASSTPACCAAIPAPSPAPGSRPGAPGGGGGKSADDPRGLVQPRWTSTSSTTRTTSSASRPERALINPDNLYILLNHIKCAAYELPFEDGELFDGVHDTAELLDYLCDQAILRHVAGRYYWMAEEFPQAGINLRSASDQNFLIVDITDPKKHRVIGEMDRFTVPMLLHQYAIYMHEGDQYQVEQLDFDDKKAYVRRVDVGLLHRRRPHHQPEGARRVRPRAHRLPDALARRGAGQFASSRCSRRYASTPMKTSAGAR